MRPDESLQQFRSKTHGPEEQGSDRAGGGSELGEATAIKLTEGGAKVAVFDLNGDAANAVAERIGVRAFAIDIADAVAGETTVATIVSDLGTPRILVNCAGVGTPMKILGKDGPVSLAALASCVPSRLLRMHRQSCR